MSAQNMIKQIIEKWKLIIETQLSKKKQEDTRLPYIPLSPTDSAEECLLKCAFVGLV